jgi:hypothetical protein
VSHITIVSCCYSRADGIREALPSWLAQEGVDFDIVIVAGPEINRVTHPNITYIDWPVTPFNGTCIGWNEGYKAARGPLIYTAYSDMVLQDKRYLARFLAHYKPNRIVNRQAIRPDGSLDIGVWGYGVLTSKELLERSGGWDTRYDGGYAWEDAHFMHAMVRAGGELVILKALPPDLGLRHVDHPSARDMADWNDKYVRNKRIYNSSFPNETIMGLYSDNRFEVIDD